MFNGLKLSTKLYLGFAAVLAITAGIGAFAYARVVHIDRTARIITSENIVGVYWMGEINALTRRTLQIAALHLLSGDEAEMKGHEAKLAESREGIDKYLADYEPTITRADDRALFDAIKAARGPFLDALNTQFLPLSRSRKVEEAKKAMNGSFHEAYGRFRDAVLAQVEFNRKYADESGARITSDVAAAKAGIVAGLAVAIAVGCAVGFLLSRSISNALGRIIASLSSGSDQISSASSQVSQSSQTLAEGAAA